MLVITAAALVSACAGDEKPITGIEIAPTMRLVAGVDSQRATVATALPQSIRVRITDQDSQPVAGFDVGWNVTAGGGTVDSLVSATDANGIARVSWTLGPVAGPQTLVAAIANGSTVVITAIAQAAGISSVAVVSDPFVSVVAGATTPPLRVRAFDRYGNSVAGVALTWTTNAGVLATAATVTGADGIGEATLRTDPSPRDHQVTARFAGGFESSFVVRGN
jgi:Bacterial Ig-like domain (group 1)